MHVSGKALGQAIIGAVLATGCISMIIALIFLINSYYFIQTNLATNRQILPSTIYASAPILRAGSPQRAEWLLDYFRRLDYQRSTGSQLKTGEYSVSKSGISFRKSSAISPAESNPPVLVVFGKTGVAKIVDLKSNLELAEYQLEPAPISDLFGGQWEKRMAVSLKEMPPHLIKAVISIEDRRFYHHVGFDLRSIARALWQNITHRDQLQGASTITQQLVKNFYLTPERSMRRKISEAGLAVVLERKLSKNEILQLYMNQVYLGQRGQMSIGGVGAASRLYFHKDVRNISLPEAALLAGLIRAPNAYNPYRHPEEARQRRNTVLLVMKDSGAITDKEYQTAIQTPIRVYPIDTRVNLAPYFGDLVKQQLLAKYDANNVYKQNLHVFTTIDLDLQEAAEQALLKGLQEIDRLRYKRVHKQVQGCLIAIEPSTGYIRAFVGGRSYSQSQYNRLIQASRQPGSSFKPVVYATALEQAFQGNRAFTPATLVSDEPSVFHFQKITWEPKNYDGEYHGIVPLRMALAHSMNVATAKLAENVGLEKIVSLANHLGITNLKPYPSLALGVFEVSPWQLAEAYTVFANQGLKTELQAISAVTDNYGKTLEHGAPAKTRILHPETAYLITDMLRTAMTQGTAAASQRMGFHRAAAGKTGTTNDFRDAWFIGYTPDLLCLVWTGYDDNSSIRMNGAQAALPIWVHFMKRATGMRPELDFQMPEGIVSKEIDPTTGKLLGPDCWEHTSELFIRGTEPMDICTPADHDAAQGLDFSNNTALINQVQQDEEPMPAFETPSNDAEEVIQSEAAEPEHPQPTYITPDPAVHAILNGEANDDNRALELQDQNTNEDLEQGEKSEEGNSPDATDVESEEEAQTQTQPN